MIIDIQAEVQRAETDRIARKQAKRHGDVFFLVMKLAAGAAALLIITYVVSRF
ncbi:MAG: hypothetical protein H0W83_03175 [Planctomycetes bacterium]|nr:hypothetical protein [Planctomycetota bacterium]